MAASGVVNHQLLSDTARFEDLPTEMKMMIAGGLLQPTGASAIDPKYYPDRPWPLRYENKPAMDTAVLRVDKSLSSIGQAVLNSCNKWIVFDIDCGNLLLSWVCASTSLFVVDCQDANHLPLGIMRVRVKLCICHDIHGFISLRRWPTQIPKRQLFIVEMGQIEAFLQALRIMELSHGVRTIPGTMVGSAVDLANQAGVITKIGWHGLQMRVDVHGGLPMHELRTLLGLFRQFHGPLNEICIQGFDDVQQARAIEQSITAPGTIEDEIILEVMMHLLRLKKLSDHYSLQGRTKLAKNLDEQAFTLLFNNMTWELDSWLGWHGVGDPKDSIFALLVMAMTEMNWLMTQVIEADKATYTSVADIMQQHPGGTFTHMANETEVTDSAWCWTLLITGLHCIFCSRIDDHTPMYRILTIRYGMSCIARIRTHPTRNFDYGETELFHDALDMCAELSGLDPGHPNAIDRAAFEQALKSWHHRFQVRLMPIKWRIHKKFIPQTLIDRGVMSILTQRSDLSEVEKGQCLVVNIVDVNELEEDDEALDEHNESGTEEDPNITLGNDQMIDHHVSGDTPKVTTSKGQVDDQAKFDGNQNVAYGDLDLPDDSDSGSDYVDEPEEDDEWKDNWYCF